MVWMLDTNFSGKLDFTEFQTLTVEITKWKNVFRTYDKDNSGKLNSFELRDALESSGFKISNRVLNALIHRYGTCGQIHFDDYILCAVKIKTMIGKLSD